MNDEHTPAPPRRDPEQLHRNGGDHGVTICVDLTDDQALAIETIARARGLRFRDLVRQTIGALAAGKVGP